MFEISINIGGLDALADSINNIADALRAGVTANEVIAKASTRKPRTPAPAAPAVVIEEVVIPEAGKPVPTDTVTSATPASTAPAAETPPAAPEQSTPASLSDAQVTAMSAAQAETVAPAVVHGPPTIAQIRAALGELVKTDKPRALAILTKHGAASVSALKEDQYAAVLAEATK